MSCLLSLVVLVALVFVGGRLYAHNPRHGLHLARLPREGTLDEVVDALIDEMSLDEKLEQLSGDGSKRRFEWRYFRNVAIYKKPAPLVYSGRNERLGLPPWAFTDGPRGVTTAEGATSFPVTMARGASWDVALEERIGRAMGAEVRAGGANYSGAVCINLLRHPGWGRAQETYGEDPVHLGAMGLALTRGIQSQGVMACVKHFACNSIENARFRVDVAIDDRALHEVYLPHFQVVCAEAASVMSAYNKLQGEHCGHSRKLLTSILRETWGYTGFVTSDWIWGVREGGPGIAAGMDVEMPARWRYRDPAVDLAHIDACVRRVLTTRLPYALRNDQDDFPPSLLGSAEHRALSKEAAEGGAVLLQNGGALPLSGRVGLIGRLADEDPTGDAGSSRVACAPVTLAEGLASRSTDLVRLATPEDAAEVDVAVVVVGYTHRDEGEYIVLDPSKGKGAWQPPGISGGGDREALGLRPQDVELIGAVAAAAPKTVVVLLGGSAITAPWRGQVDAILHAFYPGVQAGHAVAALLHGDVNPSGKLPFTVPDDEADLPAFDPWADHATYDMWHGYSLFERTGAPVAWPFGHGLSYTRFAYRDMRLERDRLGPDDTLVVTVTVDNVGERDGREVVQLYVAFPGFPVPRPKKLLRAFEKVSVPAGGSVEVRLEVPVASLAWWDEGTWRVEARGYQVAVGGSSRDADLLRSPFEVTA